MGTAEMTPEAAFDRIAPVYDRTRGPLDDGTADALAAALRARGWRKVLEVAVGTGRVAAPLQHRGLEMIGVDASRGMLQRARDKGLSRLALGSAYALPFRGRSVDGVLMAHVLHLLDDPRRALLEADRVAPGSIASLISFPDRDRPRDGRPRDDDLRRELHELLRDDGVDLPPFVPPWRKERALLLRFPPTETVPLRDRVHEEPAEKRIEMFELRGFRNLVNVPDGPLSRATAKLRERYAGRTVSSRRIYALALWRGVPSEVRGRPAATP